MSRSSKPNVASGEIKDYKVEFEKKSNEADVLHQKMLDFNKFFIPFSRSLFGVTPTNTSDFRYTCPPPAAPAGSVTPKHTKHTKWAIVALTRATGQNTHLLKRTQLMAEYLTATSMSHVENFQVDFIIFHEGDVEESQQKTIKKVVKKTHKNLKVKFLDISDIFIRTEPLSSINDAPGYTAMCRFWSFQAFPILSEMKYTHYWRVDDDIYIRRGKGSDIVGLIDEIEGPHPYTFAYKKYAGDAHGPTQLTLPSFAARWARECSNTVVLKCGDDKKEVSGEDDLCIDHFNFYNNNGAGRIDFWMRDDVRAFLDSINRAQGIEKFRWGDSTIQALAMKFFAFEEDFLFMPDEMLLQEHHKHKVIKIEPQKACKGGCSQEEEDGSVPMSKVVLKDEWSMNMHYGLLTIDFTETMMSTSFDATKLTLQNMKSYYNCTGSQTRANGDCDVNPGAYRKVISENRYTKVYNATSLYVTLSSDDYAELLLESSICKSRSDTYLIMDTNTTKSTTHEWATKITDGEAQPAGVYVADELSPMFRSWTMNMDTGVMNMTFAEPVNISSFNAESVNFQAAVNLGIEPNANTLALTNQNITKLSGDGVEISMNIGTYNLNRVKALFPLGTEHNLLYLSMSASCINDIAGNANSLAFVSIYEGKNPTVYVPDTTIPYLDHFDLNMNSEVITFYFTETVNAFQMAVEGITIQESSDRSSATHYNLTTASTKPSTDPNWIVKVNLGKSDVDAIKLIDMAVASSSAKTYVTFKTSFTRDMSVSPHLEIYPLVDDVNAMNVYQFTPDTTSPSLFSYALDMNARKFNLTFNEPVRANTLLVTYLNLQDNVDVSGNGGNKVPLTSASTTQSPNGLTISIDLCDADFNSLKLQPSMALSAATTFLTYADFNNLNAIQDMIIPPNNLAQVTDGQAFNPATFISDKTGPTLVSYSMNMNSGALNLTFSEPCDASTLNVSAIVFQNQQKKVVCNAFGQCSVAGESASYEHRLRAASSTVEDTDGLVIRVNVGVDDRNAIKVIDGFYSSISSSYLGANAGMIMDIADYDESTNVLSQNGLNELLLSSAMQATTWKPDITSPIVSVFSLNMDTGVVELTFDEPVRASTFNATGLTFMNDADDDVNTTYVNLSKESVTDSANGLTIQCRMSYDDTNALKLVTTGFSSADNTFLGTTSLTATDMAGPPGNALRPASSPMQAFLHTPDVTQPTLLSFDYDPVNKNFTLHFDEPVRVSSFDPTALTIQDLGFASQELSLVDAVAVGSDGISIQVNFGFMDKINFATAGTFFNTASNTFIRYTNGLIKDVATNPNTIVSLSDGSALQIGPTFFMYEVNLDTGLLQMRFSEPVAEDTLDPTKIVVQDGPSASLSYTLTGMNMNSTSMLHNNCTVKAYLTETDLNAIKVLPDFYSSVSNAYIRFTTGAIKDIVEGDFIGPNDLLGIADGSAVQATSFRSDVTDVEVADFSLDMNAATLTINFNEPVVASSFDPTKVTLHGASDGTLSGVQSYTLTSASSTSSVNGMQIVVDIESNGGLDQDFDEIQHLRQLATDASDTFLSITKEAVIDMSSNFNPVVPISSSSALAALTYTPDTTMPTLLGFGLNIDTKILTLTFSEAVWVDSTFSVPAITVQNSASSPTAAFTLTTDTIISQDTLDLAAAKAVPAVSVVELVIGESDLDTIKADRILAADISTTFLSVETSLTKDIAPNNNTFVAIPSSSAIQVSTYVADSVSPNLLSYTLDMDAGLMTFTFDEMVDPLTVDPTKLTLQYALFTGTNAQKFTLQTSTRTGSGTVGSRTLGITVSADDLNNIKILTGLATQSSNTYAIITTAFVNDMGANPITQLRDGSSQLVSTYTADTTRPVIQSFQLRTSGKIIVRFSEAVQISSFNSSALVLSDVDQTNSYQLTSFTSVTNTEAIETKITMSLGQDFNDMRTLVGVGLGQLTSYMSCSEYVITDFSGNKVMPIDKANAVLMGPALESFDLDMNNRFIDLRFTEELVGNFSASAITLVGDRTGAHSYTLTDWNHTTHSSEPFQPTVYIKPASTSVKVFLHPTDVEKLKELGNAATKVENTFITISTSPPLAYNEDTTSVGSPLFVVPIIAAGAMQVTSYTADVEPPTLTGYDIDKNAGSVTMRFSEPVNLKTFNVSSVTIQADEERGTGTNFLTLGGSGTSVTRTGAGHIGAVTVTITLGQYDLGFVRSLNLGQYMTLTATSAKDMSIPPNAIVPIVDGSAMVVTTLTPDTTGPSIVSFSLDLQLGLLTLVFDEPVDSSTIKPDYFSLQGVATAPPASYNLTTNTLVLSNVEETLVLDMGTFRTDLDGIKSSMLLNIADQVGTTYLAVKAGAFKDFNSNAGSEIHTHTALLAAGYEADAVKPVLRSFDLEIMDNTSPLYGMVTLHFNEPVDPTSLVFADFVLSDGASSAADTATVVLASSSASATASSSLDITLDASEMAALQGYGWANTFLTIAADAASDVSGNTLEAVDHVMIGPMLEYATLSLQKGSETANFIFSEPIDPSTFDATGITIQSATSGGVSHTLVDSVLSTASAALSSSKFLEIELGAKDVLGLKSYDGLAVSAETTNLVLEGKTVQDTAATPNTVVPIIQSSAMSVSSYTPDRSVPVLNDVVLDLSLNEITFYFDEPVLATGIKAYQITLQGSAARAGRNEYYTFTDSGFTEANNETIKMSLGFNDMSNIKSNPALCTNTTNCYATFTADTFFDTALVPNSLPIVKPEAGRQIDQVLADTKAPNLFTYDMNLETDKLTLNFDEPVVLSSFRPWLVGMQKSMTNIGSPVYNLPNDIVVTTSSGLESSSSLVIDLPAAFVETIMLDTDFAINRFTLFMMLVQGTVTDTSGNNVTAILDGTSMPATTYVADTTPPSLVQFELDMDAATATFVFDEYVVIQSVKIEAFAFTNSTLESATAHSLSLGSSLQQTVNNTKSIVVELSSLELNALKDYESLATEKNNTHVKIVGNGVEDMGGNGNVGMETENAFGCTKYTADQTTPKLRQFDLNLNYKRLTLRFTETVDASSFNINGLKLHNFAIKRFGNVFDLLGPE
ncbi:hypothetical protein TrRE_jg13421, partial [Triparma retinervis]